MFVNFCNTNFILFYFSFHTASDFCISFFYFIRLHYLHRIRVLKQVFCAVKRSKNPTIRIFINFSKHIISVINNDSFNASWITVNSFLDTSYTGFVYSSISNLHKCIRICVMNSMSKCSKSAVRIKKCYCSKSLCIVPYPYPEHAIIFFAPDRFYLHCQIFRISAQL